MIRVGTLLVLTLAAPLLLASRPVAEEQPGVRVYKSATCGCCTKWVEHLRAHGFSVQATDVPDLNQVKHEHGIPPHFASCHTALIGDYFVEGHVPAGVITRLVKERPRIAGLALPGMPIGSPGMEGPNPVAFDVLAVDAKGQVTVFASHGP